MATLSGFARNLIRLSVRRPIFLFALALAGLAHAAGATVSVTVHPSLALTERVAFGGVVADVTDSRSGATPGSLTATVEWGDGTTSSGTVTSGSPFTVSAPGHAYMDEGVFGLKVTVTDTVDSSVGSDIKNETVSEADALTGSPVAFDAIRGTSFTGTVATFTDTDLNATAGDFKATILWGDTGASLGAVVGIPGRFTVSGTHTYDRVGTFPVTVTLQDDAPSSASAQTTSTATVGAAAGTCAPSATTLCLNNFRFAVTAAWHTADGQSGAGTAVSLTSDTGYFWFFNPANVEEVVKVLNACGVNGHYWVFAGGLTNVRVETTVVDTAAHQTKTYSNPLRSAFQPLQDTAAFAGCP